LFLPSAKTGGGGEGEEEERQGGETKQRGERSSQKEGEGGRGVKWTMERRMRRSGNIIEENGER
jgi:hypothetical protein